MSLHSKLLTSEDDKLLAHVLRRHKELRLADLRSEAMEALVESAAEMGLELDWRRLNRIGAALGGRAGGEFFVPPAIVEVCRALARHRGEPFDLALDPFARQGLLLSALVDEGIAVRGVGRRAKQERRARVGTDDLWVDLSSEPAPVPGGSGGGSFEFDASATSELLVQLTGRDQGSLDLVVCCPPWGSCSGNIAKDRTRFRQLQHQLFFEAHRQLTQGGKMVFLMPASFWWAAEAKRLLEHAATEGGLTVDAAFHLAPGSVPGFPGSAYIVVATAGVHDGFQHSERGKLFAAELDDNEHRTAAVLQNLVDGRPGESLALGEFVDASSFRGFPSLVAAEDLKLLKRGRELEFVALSDVSVRIRRADRKSLAPGTLFIRRIGSERVASASADPAVLDEHPSRWVAVEVDLERADPEYLANWLNTKSGRVARRAVAFGGALMQVRERDLGELLVHLPPLEEQGERLRILARTRELTSVLRSVEEAAFLPSATIASLEESLSFDQREREVSLEEWSETLPFPLASVLRRYRQEADDPERAAGALLHFFEAFGEFWATVLISALEQEREIPGPRTTEIRSQIEAY
ncbi:MAG: hypothetical protein KAI24_26235, partial [Planctomycetes bacterium]|nr:hypothetical protein [Planctomycetota bacterium]